MGDSAGFKYHAGKSAGGIGYEVGTSLTLMADYHNPAIMFRGDATPKVSEDVGMTLRVGGEGGTNDFVLTPWDVQSKRVYTPGGTSPALASGTGEGMNIQPIVLQGGGTTSLNSHGSGYETDGACYTLNNIDRHAVAFAQNTRDEVRLFGGDGDTVWALSAQPGMKQTSYVMTQFGEVAGTLSARADSSPCVDRGQNVVCMGSQQGRSAVYEDVCPTVTSAAGTSGNNQPVVCMQDGQATGGLHTSSDKNDHCVCQTAHQNASGEVCMTDEMAGTITAQSSVSRQQIVCMSSGQANAEIREDGGAPSLTCLHESPIVAMADDNGKAAVDEGMCGSLKVGGGCAAPSNGEEVIGALCARDYKGVGSQFVSEGKVICQRK